MEIIAKSKFIRTSPRKLQLVASLLPGLVANRAIEMLTHLNKSASKDLILVIKQGLGNAQNFNLDKKTLTVKTVEIGKGPIIKRFRPVSRGRAHSIHKHTAHIRMTLEGFEPEKEKTEKKKKV